MEEEKIIQEYLKNLTIEEALKITQEKIKGRQIPGKNKALIDMLYQTQGIEEFLTEEEEKEYQIAHAVASWVTSQALDSDLNFHIPLEKDQKEAYEIMEKYARKYNYSWAPFGIPENKNKL